MEQSPTTDRAVSLDEAISIAIRLQQNDQWVAAGDMYRRILERSPDYPDALHYAGVLAHQEGRSDDAVALIERSLALEPNRADWHSNLAIVLRDRLRLDEAVAACRRAVAIDPNHANALNNLGVLLRAQGKLDEAEAVYRDAGFAPTYRTGRGTGCSILEPPEFKSGDKTRLREGMTFAVDGGITVPGKFGARVGDTIVVTNTGSDHLTCYPKALRIL